MSKYQTEAGIECTSEEDKLIDSLKNSVTTIDGILNDGGDW